MVTSIIQTLWDISRMTQQIPIRQGKLPEGDNIDTQYSIALDDMESASRLGLFDRISLWDIIELIQKLSRDNLPGNR